MSLRIGLVTSEFPPDHGGVETYSWQLARELGQRPDLRVTVYAPPKSARITPPPGVTIKPVLRSCMHLDWPTLKNQPIDVWHALSACHAWIAEKKRPTVVSVHGNDFLAPYPLTMRPALALPGLRALRPLAWRCLRPLWRHATQRMLARALTDTESIFANSRYTAEALRRQHAVDPEKIRIAYVGVDPAFFEVQRAPSGSLTQLLTVCRLSEPRKNVDRVLHALAALKDRFAFEYTIVGEGKLRPELQHLAETLGLAGRVRFAGRVDDRTLHDLYANAALFVLPASVVPGSHEGFGIVYLEAAASGLPSLAARLAGAAEAVAEGRSGFFVDTPDIASIRDALARYLGGEMHFNADACRAFARDFSWKRVADVCEAAYREIPVREFRP